ncbi:MAG: PAS domain-containing protein, partial [Anaerolineae bacterium]|nr:PAS domain-containing protein [Anaerolineae bacterium]
MKSPTDLSLESHCSGSFLASFPDTVLRCTADGVVTAYHRGVADVGIADQDVVGQSLRVLLPDPAAQVLLATLKQTLEGAAPRSAGYALVPSDGQRAERRYFEARTVPEGDSHVLCVIRDITEQRIAEQGLIRRDLYLGALTQVHHRLLAAPPQDGPVTSDTLAMLGYAAGADLAYYADLSGTSLDGDLPVAGLVWRGDQRISQLEPIDLGMHLRRRPFAYWLKALKSGRSVQAFLTAAAVDKANGTTLPGTCLVLPIIVQGQLMGLLGLESYVKSEPWPDDEVDYLRAATAAIVFHIERANVVAQLEENAEEIVRMNVQLADARDLARASDRAKSEFLAVIGHEIRTPLNPVISMTEMLLGTGLTPEQRDYAELAHEAANLLLVQINAILDYIDVESGILKLEKLPFDPVDVVETVADLFKPQAQERRLTLMTFCHPDLPPQVLGDPARLGAVLENLLDNALKFTEEGEIILRVEPVYSEPAGEMGTVSLRFSVSDTGMGLPEGAEEWL